MNQKDTKENPVSALVTPLGQIEILGETMCSRVECEETGCLFPFCCRPTGELFNTEEDAREKYPNLELI